MQKLMAAVAALALAGCLVGGSDKYFPPASDLPDGLQPVATDSAEWQMVGPVLGMSTNPGSMEALYALPQEALGHIDAAEGYLLKGPNATADLYAILVVHFNSTSSIGAELASETGEACQGEDRAHVLRDGLAYILIGGDNDTEQGAATLLALAKAVQARSGATLVC